MNPGGEQQPTAPSRLEDLDMVGRLVLTTDGTVTPMLEHIVGEPVITARVEQRYEEADDATRTLLRASAGDRLLSRTADLVGARSGAVYIRAKSVAVPRALPPELRQSLLQGRESIGMMLRRQRVETFREILTYEVDGERPTRWASRQYRVFIAGTPVLLISETFSAPCLRSPSAEGVGTVSGGSSNRR